MKFDLRKHTKYLLVHGSRAYGIHTETSDVDLKGFAIPPIEYYLSPFKGNDENGKSGFQQVDNQKSIEKYFFYDLNEDEKKVSKDQKVEGTIYDFKKFIRLCIGMNPSVIECLFVRDEEIRITSPIAEAIRELAPDFLSIKAKWTYTGYALDQLNKIKRHRDWLLNPPSKPPERSEFDLPKEIFMNKSERNALEQVIKMHKNKLNSFLENEYEQDYEKFTSDVVDLAKNFGLNERSSYLLAQEKAFEKSLNNWKKYQNWIKDKNENRFVLGKKHSYDTKHAAHLIRLLKTGKEILSTGKMNVYRADDAQELIDIRNGMLTYEELIEYATGINKEVEEIYDQGRSCLPASPNKEKIEKFCIEWIEKEFKI